MHVSVKVTSQTAAKAQSLWRNGTLSLCIVYSLKLETDPAWRMFSATASRTSQSWLHVTTGGGNIWTRFARNIPKSLNNRAFSCFSRVLAYCRPGVLKLWGAPQEGAVGPLGGASFCMRDIYFERNMNARQNIYFGTHCIWFKYFIYQLVPVLAPKYKQHILSPAKDRFFFVATLRLIKSKWHCCRSSYSFRIIMPTKEIIAHLASHSFTKPIFHTISLPILWEAQGRDLKSGPQ
jgi:hypothetical protein